MGGRLPGKGTGYPAPSPQTRTCAMNASGSSVANSLRAWLTTQATPRLAHTFAGPGPARCCACSWVAAALMSDVGHPQTSASFRGPCGYACSASIAQHAQDARRPLQASYSRHVYQSLGRSRAVSLLPSDTAL
jgi:hypothetical protein